MHVAHYKIAALTVNISTTPSILWTTTLIDFPTTPTAYAQRKAVGRALATQLLVAIEDGQWTIETDVRGKPVVGGTSSRYVSIAHTRNVVVAAASAIGPVGIDVEFRDPARNVRGLALTAFGPEECAAVATQGMPAFYRIWTLREAISKAVGSGLILVTDRVDRVPVDMADGLVVAAGDDWLVAHDVIMQDISLGLAIQVASEDVRGATLACNLASLRLH